MMVEMTPKTQIYTQLSQYIFVCVCVGWGTQQVPGPLDTRLVLSQSLRQDLCVLLVLQEELHEEENKGLVPLEAPANIILNKSYKNNVKKPQEW